MTTKGKYILTKKHTKAIDDFIFRLVNMKAEAMRIGLIRTSHALEEPQTVVGWEVADILDGKQVIPKGLTR